MQPTQLFLEMAKLALHDLKAKVRKSPGAAV